MNATFSLLVILVALLCTISLNAYHIGYQTIVSTNSNINSRKDESRKQTRTINTVAGSSHGQQRLYAVGRAGFDRNQRNAAPPPPINRNIRVRGEVRVLGPSEETEDGEDGPEEMLGVMSIEEAIDRAMEIGLDLVLINENASPPVCKIIDYGKFKYENERKKKINAKKQVKSDIKEVKMSYKIDEGDFDVRFKRVQKFISEGDRVSFAVAL
jgi:translation initiation factor IF-3